MAVAGLLSLMVTWWSSPIDTAKANRFGRRRLRAARHHPVGYAALAFALGVTAGVFIRRTLPAMASTLVAFVVVRVARSTWIRPHLMAAGTPAFPRSAPGNGHRLLPDAGWASRCMAGPPNIPNAWAISSDVVNNAGQARLPRS